MGCKYCTEYEDLPEHIINGEPIGRVFDTCIQEDENGWHLESPSGPDIGIEFYPYCGRNLEKGANCNISPYQIGDTISDEQTEEYLKNNKLLYNKISFTKEKIKYEKYNNAGYRNY